MHPLHSTSPVVWRHGAVVGAAARQVPEETAVAITFQRETYAVMMATPADLHDFAAGFCLTEGVVADPTEIGEVDIVEQPRGIELRIEIAADRLAALTARRRRMAGPTGCGLCGIESLDEAARAPRRVGPGRSIAPAEVAAALRAMMPMQVLNQATRAVHAAAFWCNGEIAAVREDVGRHNALDKLVGAVARAGMAGKDGMLLLTSRVSIEMVQKASVLGAPVLVAVSAPTAHAIRVAEAAGVTLVGIAREDGFEVFTHPHRIGLERARNVA